LKEQNAHGKSYRNRMTTGEFKEQNVHGKSYSNRMTTGELQGQVLLDARPDQEQNHNEKS
jgi:hypothetical protein